MTPVGQGTKYVMAAQFHKPHGRHGSEHLSCSSSGATIDYGSLLLIFLHPDLPDYTIMAINFSQAHRELVGTCMDSSGIGLQPRPWLVQEGRVFLAGDAAHCFPPAGGFGMNTGIQVSRLL